MFQNSGDFCIVYTMGSQSVACATNEKDISGLLDAWTAEKWDEGA